MPLHHGILYGFLNVPSPPAIFDGLFPVKTKFNSDRDGAAAFRDIFNHPGEMRDVSNPYQFEF
jgi:hypothetical protein